MVKKKAVGKSIMFLAEKSSLRKSTKFSDKFLIRRFFGASISFLVSIVLLTSCTFKKADPGTTENPIRIFFTPSVEAKLLEDQSKVFKKILEDLTPYKYEVRIPQSYVAVVEAFGAKRADIAIVNTFGYIMANEKYGTEAKITVIRHGSPTYQSQFLAKEDSGIKSVKDLQGKKIAFVDPASASGYLLPMKLMNDNNVKAAESVFAMRHDNVVSMIYQGQVDAGATFHSPIAEGEIQDARRLVKSQYPDIESKVKIISLTDNIPNDPIIFRKELPVELKKTISDAFMKLIKMPEGYTAFKKLYDVTDLKRATDKDYDVVRELLKSVGGSAEALFKKKK